MVDAGLVRVKVDAEELIRMGPRRPARPYAKAKELFPMGIFSRTRDIIAANVTDLPTRRRTPAKLIRMIILDGGDLVECDPPRRGRSPTRRRCAARSTSSAAAGRLGREGRAALSKGREDLAKAAVREAEGGRHDRQLNAEIEVLETLAR